MQKYLINWKMHVLFYSTIDFYKTLEENKKTDFLIDLLKKEKNVIIFYFILFVLKNVSIYLTLFDFF